MTAITGQNDAAQKDTAQKDAAQQDIGPRSGRDRPRASRAQVWALVLASTGSFMVILDMMIVATALTAIRRSLHASIGGLEWTVNAYTLSFAVLLLTAAALGDRLGRRRVFASGLGLFALGSAACALSPNLGVLIAARVVQGAGAAAVLPLGLALLNLAFPPERRGWAIGVYGGITGTAALAGPVLGGLITQGLAWQWIFWVNVPIALVAIPFVLARLAESRAPSAGLDLVGVALAGVAVLGFAWGLVRGGTVGWASPEVVGAMCGGALFLIGFVLWERRTASAMLPPRLFGSRGLATASLVIFCLMAVLSGSLFFAAQFLQVVQNQGPLGAGLRLAPWGLMPILLGPRAGAMINRIGERALVLIGLAFETAGTAWLAFVASPGVAYPELCAGFVLSGIGISLAVPAATKAMAGSVPPADLGKASGAFSTMRQLGGAFGVAILGAAFAVSGSYTSGHAYTVGFQHAMEAGVGLAVAGYAAAALMPSTRRSSRMQGSNIAAQAPADGSSVSVG
jgi:EmrB/QacA subfamily drug resistance transporter